MSRINDDNNIDPEIFVDPDVINDPNKNYKILSFRDRLNRLCITISTIKAILLSEKFIEESGFALNSSTREITNLADYINELYILIDLAYKFLEGGNDTMRSPISKTDLDKSEQKREKVIIDGQERDIVQSRDYSGRYSYPRTITTAVYLSDNEGGAKLDNLDELLKNLENDIYDLLIASVPLEIKNFRVNNERTVNFERGQEIPDLKFDWNINRDLVEHSLDLRQVTGKIEDIESKNVGRDFSVDYDYTANSDKIKIKTDNRGRYIVTINAKAVIDYNDIGNHSNDEPKIEIFSDKVTINVSDSFYWGVLDSDTFIVERLNELSKDFIHAEDNEVKTTVFNWPASNNEKYMYIAIPEGFDPTFSIYVNGHCLGPGGIILVASDIDLTNSNGILPKYNIFRSAYPNIDANNSNKIFVVINYSVEEDQ